MATATSNVSKAQQKTNSTAETGASSHPYTDIAQDTLHSSVDRLAKTAAKAEENLRNTAADSAENMASRKAQMDAKWQASGVRKYAVENPVAAAGIAFAAGMLVTSLLRKK
ncbi:DUF883 domain-containing protein [Aestuariibacter sp. A3R04]|uniref:DUF883 domain-containing protein n=1 Tax=Aestuariibacter sp. A3R04 TaxID=2841571 RepID=UPI001C09C4ED|nr:DUF883 domain-containing protein [Aestuariibacter sp. A3R04]MBU3023224.1 DUF883 domain-containing protein [Aestuariibacter sp. A3R04]